MRKMKTGSRLVSLLLAVLMLIAYMPLLGEAVYAEDGVPVITTDKTVYTVGEDINVTTDINGASGGWVAMYAGDVTSYDTSILWYYPENVDNPKKLQSIVTDVNGNNENWGNPNYDGKDIPAGEYQLVYAYGSKPYAIKGEPVRFTIEEEQVNNTIKTDKDTYYMSDPIMVTINSDITSYTWVGLYGKDETPNAAQNPASILWKDDYSFGTEFNLLEWSSGHGKKNREYVPGEYKIVFFGDDGFTNIVDTAYITIEADPVISNTTVTTDKAEYDFGEAINVTCSTEDTTDGWIGVYDEGTTVSPASHSTPAYIWYYPTKGGVESTQNLNAITDSGNFGNGYAGPPLGAGNYKVVYLSGSYEVLAQANFTVKMKPSTLSVDKRVYKVNEPIKVTATSDYASAWVGFYPYRGGDPLDNGDLKAYYNLSDFETDTVDIINGEAVADKEKVKDLPDGRYKVILFTGGWDIDDSRGSLCIESFYVYDPDKLFTWYEENGEWKAYATFTDQGPMEVDAVVTAVTTDATCSAAGKTVYTATVDADAIDGAITGSLAATLKTAVPFTDTKTVEIPALEHDYQEVADSAKAATCTEAGKEADKKCSLCGDVVTGAEIPATGHTEETVDGKEATCTATGLTEGKKCSVCGEVLVAQEEIPATGHTEETVAAKEATCTETGLTEGKRCSVCGEVLVAQEEVAALGHDYKEVEGTAKAATSKEEGKEADKKCSRCGDVITGAVIPKLEPTEEEKAAEAAKEELNKAVDEAKKVEQGNYTDESFKALQDAIAEAEALAKDENATKEQLDAAAAKVAAAQAALEEKEPEIGTEVKYSSNTYKVTSAPGAATKTVAFTKAKNTKTVTVPSTMKINGETYKVTSVAAKAFKGSKCTTAYIGANVKKLDKYAFRYSKVKTVYIKSKLLSKTRVKGSLKYSKVTTVKAKVSTKKSTNKKYAKKFKSYFTKANAGKKVTVKY